MPCPGVWQHISNLLLLLLLRGGGFGSAGGCSRHMLRSDWVLPQQVARMLDGMGCMGVEGTARLQTRPPDLHIVAADAAF